MAEIAFKTIAEIVVALFAVGFFLFIIEAMLPGATGNTFCSIGNAISSLPIPSYVKPSLDQCGLAKATKRQELGELTEESLAGYIMDCWEKNDYGRGGLTHDCYELFVYSVPNKITEATFTAYLQENGLCDKLQNNFLDDSYEMTACGGANNVLWIMAKGSAEKGNITGEEVTVIIKYNAFDHRIDIP